MPAALLIGACAAVLAVLSTPVPAMPVVRDGADVVAVRGNGYELRLSRREGVFDLLTADGKGGLASVMRPGGEMGWYGYNTDDGGGRSTRTVKPTVTLRKHARGVTVTVRCLLDSAGGVTHTAQYDCLERCVVVCSRYAAKAPPAGLALLRCGPKLDVDIDRMDQIAFTDAAGSLRTRSLRGRQREFYAGPCAWAGDDMGAEVASADPAVALSGPSGCRLAVAYPFVRQLWERVPRFLQLYTDGGNYWYTGAGKASAFNRDFVLCLAGDPGADARQCVADAEAAVAKGEVTATVRPLPGPADGPLYLVNYDHAVGFPRIQEEARRSASFLKEWPELRVGLQAEGFTWDWLAKNDPAFVREAKGWMSEFNGRWLPGGGSYAQPYFTFISEESGFRQMLYGTRALKQHLGWDNRIYLYSEHETMPQLPQVLAGMGYRGAFFRTHMDYGGDGPAMDADWVRWTGPDGSAIRAVPAYTGREHALGNEWLLINYKPGINWYKGAPCAWPDMEGFRTEMLARGVSRPIVSRCEDWYTRPSRPLLEDVRAHKADNVRWATAEEMFTLLEKSGKPAPVMRSGPNDFRPRQPWGYTGNRTWTAPRMASARALTAEALASAAIRKGFRWTAAHQQRLDQAWKDLMVAEHHDALICALFNEGRDYTEPSVRASDALSAEAAGYLADRLNVAGPAVFVFNAAGHARTEAVFVKEASGFGAVIGPDGKQAPLQRDGAGGWFTARAVPALGYAAYRLVPGEAQGMAPAAGLTLTGDRFELEFGRDGGIVRLRDRTTGRDLVAPGGASGRLRGLINSAAAESRGAVTVTAGGPCVWRAVEAGRIADVGYEITYTLAAGCPRVDIKVKLRIPKGTRIACPGDSGTPDSRRNAGMSHQNGGKLRLVIETALPETATAVRHQPLIIAEMQGRPATIDANLWAGLEAAGAGLAVANRGSMGLRREGRALEPILAYSGEYVWGDNFLEGEYEFDLSLAPYAGKAGRADAHAQALAFDRPLYALPFAGRSGREAPVGSALPLPSLPPQVAVQALFPQDGALFLRLCNMGPAPLRAKLPPCRTADAALRVGKPVAAPVTLAPWRAQTYAMGIAARPSP
jgi:alpha-mannosidase